MAPDGYTWLLGAVHHSIAPTMYTNLLYDITKAFEPIAIIDSVPRVIVVNPNKFPKNDLKNPSWRKFANILVNTITHLLVELAAIFKGRGNNLANVNQVILLSSIPKPQSNIYCVGWNYLDHFDEGKDRRADQGVKEYPKVPILFTVPRP